MRFLLIMLLGFSVLSANAQFSIGPKVGATYSDVANLDEAKPYFGYQLGVLFDYGLTDRVSFQQDILLSQRGTILVQDSMENREDLYYFEVSFMPKVNLALKKVQPYLTAGPYIGLIMFGHNKPTAVNAESTKTDFDEDARSLDFGFHFGAGFKVKSLVVEGRYGIGLKDYERYESGKSRFRLFTISLAYVFDLG